MIKEETYHIYALIHPETRYIRYIGVSRKPMQRLSQHITDSKHSKTYISTSEWILEMAASGLRPGLVILETIQDTKRGALNREASWIWYLRNNGVPLLNRFPVLRHSHHYSKDAPRNSTYKLVVNSSIKVLTRQPK